MKSPVLGMGWIFNRFDEFDKGFLNATLILARK